ncbi:MaoC family dehydratase N-terminal domain-containing protein [Croceicoccus sp. Ery5]|uniref:FAS1-like dehydratase domain-containing protein n=1 Tax=Croceicoccus sp. Ery5 TaxID=1703340 RepID=UPI001E62A66B|nr:MaoC family dehydratase N-terminal domain-containing protein [Croceicoccus sp. Ery5]
MNNETHDWSDWIGRTQEERDLLSASDVGQLAGALFGREWTADSGFAPPLAHWMCFRPAWMRDATGTDGHPARGGFLPPVPLPRRMWAGGALEWHRPVPVDVPLRRISTVASVTAKQGASGALVFVSVDHAISDPDGPVVNERQDIVYRADPAAGTPARDAGRPAPDLPATAGLRPDPVMLFRFSALTGNSHRIHYDAAYAREEEHYPALVVHGPLTAMALLDHATRVAGRHPAHFRFRGTRPLFLGDTITLGCGLPDGDRTVTLAASDQTGALCMQADARFTPGQD